MLSELTTGLLHTQGNPYHQRWRDWNSAPPDNADEQRYLSNPHRSYEVTRAPQQLDAMHSTTTGDQTSSHREPKQNQPTEAKELQTKKQHKIKVNSQNPYII